MEAFRIWIFTELVIVEVLHSFTLSLHICCYTVRPKKINNRYQYLYIELFASLKLYNVTMCSNLWQAYIITALICQQMWPRWPTRPLMMGHAVHSKEKRKVMFYNPTYVIPSKGTAQPELWPSSAHSTALSHSWNSKRIHCMSMLTFCLQSSHIMHHYRYCICV